MKLLSAVLALALLAPVSAVFADDAAAPTAEQCAKDATLPGCPVAEPAAAEEAK